MANIDVFNGDADGICSLVQLRLANPQESELVTGVKRDINLLKHVDAGNGDDLTVLDISMQKNQEDLARLLTNGASVFYADHHNLGEMMEHPKLSAHVNISPSVCTALIVDKFLGGQFHLWAITGAYGDNLIKVADELAHKHGLAKVQAEQLHELGKYLNYNSYGASLDDLFYHPAYLYRECVQFYNPLDFIKQNNPVFEKLKTGYQQDCALAKKLEPSYQTPSVTVFTLPNEIWARRVSGIFSNQLSNDNPKRAHVILTEKIDGDYLVSIRAPLIELEGADEIASQFRTGGGRKGAAGINSLPKDELNILMKLVEQRYG